jgi:hypothetical protein
VKELPLRVPENVASDKIALIIDSAIGDLGLDVAMRGGLKSFPGSTHWHLKRGSVRGTLEITWWPKARSLWMKIQKGRNAAWISQAVPKLKHRIETQFRCFSD